MELTWEKPVIIFYKERRDEPEKKAFLIIKAKKLVVSRAEENTPYVGIIQDFFPLMGDIDYVPSEDRTPERYVLC